MGRKNKIIKKSKNIFVREKEDIIDYSDVKDEILDNNKIRAIHDLNEELIKYCDTNCIPLCDYINPYILSEFIEFSKNN